jgi:hypothetical protein
MTRALSSRIVDVTPEGLKRRHKSLNVVAVQLYPELLEESRREVERTLERKRQIQDARATRRAERSSRFATYTRRLRRRPQPEPRRPLVEGC